MFDGFKVFFYLSIFFVRYSQSLAHIVASNICMECVEDLSSADKFKRKYQQSIEKSLGTDKTKCTSPVEVKFQSNEVENIKPNEQDRGYIIVSKKPKIDKQLVFMCDKCNKEFKTKGSLQQHLERHAKKRNQYHCKKCNSSFLTTPLFRNHLCEN